MRRMAYLQAASGAGGRSGTTRSPARRARGASRWGASAGSATRRADNRAERARRTLELSVTRSGRWWTGPEGFFMPHGLTDVQTGDYLPTRPRLRAYTCLREIRLTWRPRFPYE